jgi:endonuclease-3
MNPRQRHEIFTRLRSANPHPTTELDYQSPFELLVSVVLSAQATDKSVNLATDRLFKIANTPQALLALGRRGLERHIKSIGLFRTKAKNLIATCKLLIERHDGAVPRTREELQALPGVGRKTANVILNTAFGEPTIAVDTHIFRVANRTGIAPGRDVLAVETKLLKFVPEEFQRDAHHWLILHGRYVCKARKPDCPACPIRDLCDYRQKTQRPETGD